MAAPTPRPQNGEEDRAARSNEDQEREEPPKAPTAAPTSWPQNGEEDRAARSNEDQEREEPHKAPTAAPTWQLQNSEEDHAVFINEDQEHEELHEAEEKESEGPAQETPSVLGAAKTLMMCSLLVALGIYESLVKARAVREVRMDKSTLVLMQSLVSMAIGVAAAKLSGTEEHLRRDVWKQIGAQAIPGVLFSCAMYLQLLAVQYISPDVFKVLDKTSLLVMAVLSGLILKKRLSIASWFSLMCISMACICYWQVRTMDAVSADYRSLLTEYSENGEAFRTHESDRLHALLGARVSKYLPLSASSNTGLGTTLCAISVLMACVGCVCSESVMKSSDSPYYVQKVFMEITAAATMLLMSAFQSTRLRSALGWGPLGEPSMYDVGPFLGWSNPWVLLAFVLILAKSWLTGFIVMTMSALTKQLCSIVVVVALYFFTLMHSDCPDGGFFCPSGLWHASKSVIAADCLVFLTVTSYTAAVRDKKRKGALKAQLAEAQRQLPAETTPLLARSKV